MDGLFKGLMRCNKNHTYRPVTAFFLIALVIQVFVLKDLHQCVRHDCDLETSSVEGTHVHAEGSGNLSCYICLFHSPPTDLPTYIWTIQLPDIVPNESQFTYRQCRLAKKLRQAHLRGPPPVTA